MGSEQTTKTINYGVQAEDDDVILCNSKQEAKDIIRCFKLLDPRCDVSLVKQTEIVTIERTEWVKTR